MKYRLRRPENYAPRNLLSSRLIWSHMVRPGVVLHKDGGLQQTWTYRGTDFDTMSRAQQARACEVLARALENLGHQFALHLEYAHEPADLAGLPPSHFAQYLPRTIEAAREVVRRELRPMFEGRYYLTLSYQPDSQALSALTSKLMDSDEAPKASWLERLRQGERLRDILRPPERAPTSYTIPDNETLDAFETASERFARAASPVFRHIRRLTPSETLTYLKSTISPKRGKVAASNIILRLDATLPDVPIEIGTKMRMGDHHVAILGIRGYPDETHPNPFRKLLRLDFPFRLTTRILPMGRTEAIELLGPLADRFDAGSKSLKTGKADSDGAADRASIESVLKAVQRGELGVGYYTTNIHLMHQDPKVLQGYVTRMEEQLTHLEFTSCLEKHTLPHVFFGSLPGHNRPNPRRAILTTKNLAHLVPTHEPNAGAPSTPHLGGPSLMIVRSGQTRHFLNLYGDGDLGHTFVVGTSGAGKSTLLSMMGLQFLRYERARIIMFDKGATSRASTLGCGGTFYDLKLSGEDLSFQPLRHVHDAQEREFLEGWIESIVGAQLGLGPDEVLKGPKKAALTKALDLISHQPVHIRTMSTFVTFVQDVELREALSKFTDPEKPGSWGKLFDANEERLARVPWMTFEMSTLMDSRPALVDATLRYLFHRLNGLFKDEVPTLLILDEAWAILKNKKFMDEFESWIREARKKNVAVVFATQDLDEVMADGVPQIFVTQVPNRILTANANATASQPRKLYEKLELNEVQIERLANILKPKRDYLFVSPDRGSAEFELDLSVLELAFAGAGSPSFQPKITKAWEQTQATLGARPELSERRGAIFCAYYLRILARNQPELTQYVSSFEGRIPGGLS